MFAVRSTHIRPSDHRVGSRLRQPDALVPDFRRLFTDRRRLRPLRGRRHLQPSMTTGRGLYPTRPRRRCGSDRVSRGDDSGGAGFAAVSYEQCDHERDCDHSGHELESQGISAIAEHVGDGFVDSASLDLDVRGEGLADWKAARMAVPMAESHGDAEHA